MIDDNIEERGFISKDRILEYVSEQEIFELVFGFQPEEFEQTTSPFREDTNPGCWFETDLSTNILKFIDFGNPDVIMGIKMSHIDCFNAVQVFFQLKNFYKTLEYIKHRLIDGKDLTRKTMSIIKVEEKKETKLRVDIKIQTTLYTQRDGRFWAPYGISKENLIEDGTFSVYKFKLLNAKNGDYTLRPKDMCFAYTGFAEGRKKLYRPYQKGKGKFITNCTANDIYGLPTLADFGDVLFITKSYKDWRVIKNQGTHCVGFQNEGMIPSVEILLDLARRFKKIYIFFDNDNAGIAAGIKVRNAFNKIYKNKAIHIHLPISLIQYSITDASDFYKKRSPGDLINFLKENTLWI